VCLKLLNHTLRYFYGGEPKTPLFTAKEVKAARVWKPIICPVWWLSSYDWPFWHNFESHIYTTGSEANWWLCSVCCGQHWLGHIVVKFPNHVLYYIRNKNSDHQIFSCVHSPWCVTQDIFHHLISSLKIYSLI